MKISIFGLGYVGCVSLGCLAKNGHKVIGVDINKNKVELINQGRPTIIEEEIDYILNSAFKNNKISATTDALSAVKESDISIIAVGTPSTKNGHLDLKYIYRVAQDIGEALKQKSSFHIIVIRSTVLPGTNFKVGEIIEKYAKKERNKDFAVVSNPEFLREGSAVEDFYNPPVTVLASDNSSALETIEEIYAKINAPIKRVDIKVAELIKYVNNTFHALKITFANEIGNICKKLDLDSYEVMDLFTMDTQLNISSTYLKPGFAYGGSCLPKDLMGLNTIAHDNYLITPVLNAIELSNKNHMKVAMNLIESRKSKNVGIIGLSFKPGTDDLRYSPMVELAEYMLGKGYKLEIYDKNVSISKLTGTNKEYIEQHIPHLSNIITDDMIHVVQKSEIIIFAQNVDDAEKIVTRFPEKYFIDLVRVTYGKYSNYEGICW